jgi:hypothetical protein
MQRDQHQGGTLAHHEAGEEGMGIAGAEQAQHDLGAGDRHPLRDPAQRERAHHAPIESPAIER